MQFKNLIKRTVIGAAFITGLFLSSCKKENKQNPQISNAIKKVATEDESMIFEYNADGTIRKATISDEEVTNGDTVIYTVSYNAAKQITEVIADNGEKIIPVYENGILVRAFLKDELDEELGFTEYEYFNGKNTKTEFYTKIGNVIFPLIMFQFNYNAAGNIEKTSIYLQNPAAPNSLDFTGSISYEYDTKENPLEKAKEFLKLLWISTAKNNTLKETHKDKNGVVEETVEYTYQYNSSGNPGSGTVKRSPAGVAETKNIQFTY